MSRKQSSGFDQLIEMASRMPWQVAVGLAIVSYFTLHSVASLQPLQGVSTDTKVFWQSLSAVMIRQVVITVCMFLQYLVPLGFVVGAGISFFRRRRQGELHLSVARAPQRSVLEHMTWREFEGLVAEMFRRKGFEVRERGGKGPDGGVDLELQTGKDKYLVQCKQWKSTKVGVAVVRELYGVMAAEGAVGGFVVASGEFTDEAQRFAEGRSIELVATGDLLGMIRETAREPVSMPRQALAPACPRCGSDMVLRTARKGSNAGNSFWGCPKYPSCKGVRELSSVS